MAKRARYISWKANMNQLEGSLHSTKVKMNLQSCWSCCRLFDAWVALFTSTSRKPDTLTQFWERQRWWSWALWGSQRKCEWLQTEVSSRAGSSFESEADKCSTLLFVMRSRLRAQKAVEGNGNRYSVKSGWQAALMQLHWVSSLWREKRRRAIWKERRERFRNWRCATKWLNLLSPRSSAKFAFSINFPSVRTSFSQYADFKIFRGQWLGLTAPKLPWLKSRLWILNLNDFLLNRGLDKRTQFLRGPWVQFSGDSGWLESSRRWIGEWTPWR